MPGSLTRVTAPADNAGGVAFWLSDVEQMGETYSQWGFSVYAGKDVFLATFAYTGQAQAEAARETIVPVLKDAVSITTEVS